MTLFRLRLSWIILLVAACLACYLLFFRQNSGNANSHKTVAPLVSLTQVQSQTLPVLLTTQGHVVPLNQVDIQSQLTGTIKDIAFKEGDFVEKGQLLFTLDDSSQIATLRRTEATEAEAYAQLAKAKSDVQRGLSLKARNYISASDWDTLKSTEQQYLAQENAAQQDVNSAKVQLGYTRIYSPVKGKTGALHVHSGSLVQPGSSVPLVTVSQFDPIGVSFTLPEKNLNGILRARAQGTVVVTVSNAKGEKVKGALDFIDNTVNTDTGTITLKAHFTNPDNLLWPGAFQTVQVIAGSEKVATLPPEAIQNGPDGHFVYQIDNQNKVNAVAINLLRIQHSLAVVKGLENALPVVLEGANKIRPGMIVTVTNRSEFKQ